MNVAISENVTPTCIIRELIVPMIASRIDLSSHDICVTGILCVVLFIAFTWDFSVVISFDIVVNCENTEFTFPERVFTLFARVLTAVLNHTILPDEKLGSIFARDLFTMNENLSIGELIIPERLLF